ncbi:serine hydrolase domain-containing protein [Pseudoalteromonas luteoviolacea]|uniref:Beta-lactamase-related domain-containing protein n=1 Tax=Pseudoalteromonas luteoviolacea NCIMB 1942 TaxID=1365253 RepID=A0A166ZHZ6_9GAMM|nr:serine hydrolase domain-containing protein [Pseudoalteromonas luteoviolacea]KZN44335.1 hypothetical protein N482_16645 [Pseudoalteromonas luteoviolacea NCIMB 1942]
MAANFKAGSQFRYSTDSYAILDVLIEDITGRTFSEYVDKTILVPLSMNQSTFAQPLPKALWQQASAAFDAQGNQIKGDWRNYPKQSAAGLWTTPLDLAKYVIAVQNARKGTTTGPITPKLVDNMLSLHLGGMGLGPMLKNEKQGLVFHHSGKSAGFSNRFHAYVDKADGMIIMTNGDSARPVVSQLQNAISAHFNWDLSAHIEVTPYAMNNAKRADLVGEYAWERDNSKRMRIVKKEDEFEIDNLFEGGQFKFIAEAPDTLISTSTGVKVNIETNPQGKVTAILWSGRFRLNKQL